MLGEQKLTNQLTEAAGVEVAASVGASRMNLPGSGLYIWAAIGAALGFVVSQYVSDTVESWLIGGCVGLGMSAGMLVLDRRLRRTPGVLGGVFLGIGATSSELLLCDRGFWARRCDLLARKPIASVRGVTTRRKFFSQIVTLRFDDGDDWRFDSPRWKQIAAHLPTLPTS